MRLSPAVLLALLSWGAGCASSASETRPEGAAGAAGAAGAPVAAAPSAPAVAAAASAESARITAADLRGLVESLASDAAAGRDTGSPESLAAADRIAQALAAAGVKPAGDAGGYLQAIDTVGFRLEQVPQLGLVGPDGSETEALYGVDFTYQRGPPLSGRFEVVTAKQASEIPAARADAALLLLADGRTAQQWLSQAGAPGGAGWALILSAGPPTAGEPDDVPPRGLFKTAALGATAGATRLRLRGPLLQRARDDGLAAVRVEFGASQTTPAVNVVGMLPGVGAPGHPELAQQALVFTAHYDHLGVASSAADARRPKDAPTPAGAAPDLIYNGADDDASGVAMVLELADAFGHGPPPARTLVFLLVTGEEIGLLGTNFYLDHPAVPLEATVANVNFEMVGRPDPLVGGAGRLWLTGYERTTLGPAWTAAGLAIAADARPDEHFYERSDNIAFVRRHVIGQTLSSYNLHDDYHTVTDEPATLDYSHMQSAARTAYAACRLLADGALAPEWSVSEAAAQQAPASR